MLVLHLAFESELDLEMLVIVVVASYTFVPEPEFELDVTLLADWHHVLSAAVVVAVASHWFLLLHLAPHAV